MISLLRISLIILIFVQYAYGDQRVIHVSDQLISSDNTYNTGGKMMMAVFVVCMEIVLVIPLIMHWLILLVMFWLILQLM